MHIALNFSTGAKCPTLKTIRQTNLQVIGQNEEESVLTFFSTWKTQRNTELEYMSSTCCEFIEYHCVFFTVPVLLLGGSYKHHSSTPATFHLETNTFKTHHFSICYTGDSGKRAFTKIRRTFVSAQGWVLIAASTLCIPYNTSSFANDGALVTLPPKCSLRCSCGLCKV